MARWFSALIRRRRPLVRALCSGSSGGIGSGGGIGGIGGISGGGGGGGIVLPVWPIGSEMRYSQMMYVGEAGTRIDSDKTEEVSSLCDLLLSKPNVFQALKDWIRDGNRFSSSFFTKVYYRLAKRRRYKEILQLLKGIREENILETTEMHYIWEMAITCRQHTTFGAEDFYHRIPTNRKTDEVTAALIFSLAKQNALAKCESWIERTTVVSTDILNMLMQLYLSRDRHDKVLETYQRMRKTKMDPSIYTYLMLLTYKDKVGGGLDGIEAEAAEFVEGIDLETAVKRTLKEIMEINGFLARADRVDEIWNRLKNIKGAQEIDQTCYISAIASFGRAKDIENAERVYQELIKQDLSKHIPNPHSIMIEAYVVSGLMAEAEHILRNSLKDAVFCPYNSLVRGYIASGAADTALARLKEGVAAIPVKNIRPAYKTMMALLPVFAARRDVEGAERIMFHYRFAGDAAVYNELLKVYVACSVLPNDFRDRMQRNDVEGDEITEELLESVKSSPSAAMKEQRRRLHSANCRKTLAWLRLSKSIVPFRYDLELWVDLDSCQFKGILVEPARYVCLNSADLSITSVVLQKNKVLWPTRSVENSEDETLNLEFGDNLVLNPGDDASVTIEYHGNLNEKLDGFYKSLYRDENGAIKYMAVGVFEPADARRFFPCWDEPSFKARFKFKVHAPPDRVVLSNMPAIRETISDNIKIVEFEESIPMSTYIVTVVVGEFEYMEAATEDGTIVRVYARPGLLHKGKFALDLTLKLLPYFSKLFGTRYPLPKLDLVAVPTFKAGALENFGCVVYLEEALLLEENSSASLCQQVALDTAHEIAHMWFGNLVTIEWWTHLWLNEGMATWMSYYAIDHIFPEWNIWLSFSEIKEAGQRLDALVSSHPVEVPVGNVKEAAGAFDSISYCKGASIVHMLQTYLGPADLQAALASYIRKFAFSNADSDDLWESFEQETGKPIKELMHSWTKQKGYPAIKATLMENDGVVQLEQYHFLANGSEGEGIWIVPVTFRKEGETESTALILKDEPVQVRIEPGRWIHFNPGQSGFYCVQYDSKLLELLEKSFPAALSPLDRLGILKDMLDLCRAGKQPMTELVHWLKLYENETHPAVISAIIDVSLSISGVFGVAMPELSDQVNRSLCKQLESFARSVGWEAVIGESHLTSIVRGQIFNALVELHHQETCLRASEYFESRNVPPSLMKNAMAASASFDILVEIFRSSGSSEERSSILSSLAWTSDPEIICKALEFSISDEVNPQEIPTVIWGVKVEGWVTAWSWFKEHWERVYQRLGQGFLLGRVVRALVHHIYSEAAVEEFEEVMLPRCQSKVLKSLNEALEGARLRVQWVTWVQLQAPQLVSSTF